MKSIIYKVANKRISPSDTDLFHIKLSELWFKWLEWLLIIGAFTYLGKLSGNSIVSLLAYFSHFIILNYITAHLYILRDNIFPAKTSSRRAMIYSLLVATIVSMCTVIIMKLIMTDISLTI